MERRAMAGQHSQGPVLGVLPCRPVCSGTLIANTAGNSGWHLLFTPGSQTFHSLALVSVLPHHTIRLNSCGFLVVSMKILTDKVTSRANLTGQKHSGFSRKTPWRVRVSTLLSA